MKLKVASLFLIGLVNFFEFCQATNTDTIECLTQTDEINSGNIQAGGLDETNQMDLKDIQLSHRIYYQVNKVVACTSSDG